MSHAIAALTSTTQSEAGTLKNAAINSAFCHGGAEPSCITTAQTTAVVITGLASALSAPCARINRNSAAQTPLTRKARTRCDKFVHWGPGFGIREWGFVAAAQQDNRQRTGCPYREVLVSAQDQCCIKPPLLQFPIPDSQPNSMQSKLTSVATSAS
ncbi:hypothetical protein KOJCDNHJ_00815 [Xanthomonas citri pv. punicae]|nr:hypothetical protein FICKIIDM_02065 [Xanthomonas citri pv. punicae]UIS27425.1 hypothetical protein KOJCDNHJ_00815 [Xanthomonas citri pv. punicae]